MQVVPILLNFLNIPKVNDYSRSLQMVTAAIKLKDACPLEEKLWQILTEY